MTKKEMIQEMMEGLQYTNNQKVLENRCKSKLSRVKDVYEYFQNTNKTKEDRLFCINLLVTW